MMVVEIIKNLIINLFSSYIYDKNITVSEKNEINKFTVQLTEWVRDYINNHDGTVLTTGDFESFLQYHNLIENIYRQVISSDENISKDKFIQNQIELFHKCQRHPGNNQYDTNKTLKEFITYFYDQIDSFFRSNLTLMDKYIVSKGIENSLEIKETIASVGKSNQQRFDNIDKTLQKIVREKEDETSKEKSESRKEIVYVSFDPPEDCSDTYRKDWTKTASLEDEGSKVSLKMLYIEPKFNNEKNLGDVKHAHELFNWNRFSSSNKHKVCLLLGKPGCGKSSLISYYLNESEIKKPGKDLVYEFKDSFFNDADWSDEGIKKLIQKLIRYVKEKNNGNLNDVRIFLDGFDEIHIAKDKRTLFLNILSNLIKDEDGSSSWIVLCRENYITPSDYKDGLYDVYTLIPFSKKKIEEFYRKYMEAHNRKNEIDEQVICNLTEKKKIEITSIPIILYIILASGVSFSSASSRAEIYHDAFERIYEKAYRKSNDKDRAMTSTSEEKKIKEYYREMAHRIAIYLLQFEKGGNGSKQDIHLCPYTEIQKYGEQIKKQLGIAPSISLSELTGGFYKTNLTESTDDYVEFSHRSIFEYYVSETLYLVVVNNLENKDDEWFSDKFGPFLCRGMLNEEMIDEFIWFIENGEETKNNHEFKWEKLIELFKKKCEQGCLISHNAFCRIMVANKNGNPENTFMKLSLEQNIFSNILLLLFSKKFLTNSPIIGTSFDNYLATRRVGSIPSAVNLQHVDLTGANLVYAYLKRANLNRAYMEKADLTGANLNDANLIGAHLKEAKLSSAELNGANMSSAELKDADLVNANLYEARLNGVNLSGANLNSVHLNEAKLISAELNDANLKGANLSGASLNNANLSSSDLSRSNLSRAYLVCTILQKTNLTKANLREAKLTGADLTGANLTGAIGLTNGQLSEVKSLKDCTMPDGKVYGQGSRYDEAKLNNDLVPEKNIIR